MTHVWFQCIREWNPLDIIALYRSAGWWEEDFDQAGILPLIQGSHIFVVGISEDTGKAVAMGRIISDHVKTGYIHDLCVLTEYRGREIGSHLLSFLIHTGQDYGLEYLHLVAQPGTSMFYEKSGFISENGLIFLTQDTGN
jgi:aralkylamine N-acetyltransferase